MHHYFPAPLWSQLACVQPQWGKESCSTDIVLIFLIRVLRDTVAAVCMFSTADLEIKNVPNPLRRYHLSAICPEDI